MPVNRSADHPTFDLDGNTITGLASPSRGATEVILYRADLAPGGRIPRHRHDHQDVFTVLDGSLTAIVGDQPEQVAQGDAFIVPTGEWHHIEAGPRGATVLTAMPAGTLFIRESGEQSVPPWGQ